MNEPEKTGECAGEQRQKETPWSLPHEGQPPRENPTWYKLETALEAVRETQTYTGDFPIHSHRKILGPAVESVKRAAKRLIERLLGWYIRPMWAHRNRFNHTVYSALELEMDVLQEAVEQIAELREQICAPGAASCADPAARERGTASACANMDRRMEALERRLLALSKRDALPTDNERFYQDFEERFRGSREEIRQRLRAYVPVIKAHLPDWSGERFVDVGSGRGEWLDILRENGAADYVGVDLNERQNALCKARGHQTVCEDCVAYLSALPQGSVSVITGFQLIEHLGMDVIRELFAQCHRVLKKGGMILFETPNPRNLTVGADTFYIDPSHQRILDPRLVQFMAEWSGFTKAEIIEVNANERSAPLPVPKGPKEQAELIRQLNDVKRQLWGPQDYVLFAVKE